jgi:hypothetical protein
MKPEFVAQKSGWAAVSFWRILSCILIIPIPFFVLRILTAKAYRIEFYATKRGFDRTFTAKYIEHSKRSDLHRHMPIYSEEIGRLVATVNGAEATCAANADDLYIRAKVISSVRGLIQDRPCHPEFITAWTQPVKIQ